MQLQAIVFAIATYVQPPSSRHRINRIHNQIDEHFAQFRSTAVRVMTCLSIEHHFILKPANTRNILPTSSRYLNRIVQQAAYINQLKLLHRRLARKRLNSANSRRSVFGCGLNDVEISDQRRLLYLAPQQLRASENCSQRVVEIVRYARRELAQRAQLVSTRSALAFFFLLGDVACDSEHAGCFAFNHERRIVDARVTQLTVVREVAHLVSLWRASHRERQLFFYQQPIRFVNHAQQRPPDEVAALITKTFQCRRVAPLEVAVRDDCIARLRRALENVRQQRLMLARHCLDFAQLRKITRRANYGDRFVTLIEHWLDRHEQRSIKANRCDFDGHAATGFKRLFHNTCFIFVAGPQYVATLSAEQQSRMNRLHRRTRAIDAF